MNYALQVENISKNYPTFSLNNVNISLPKGYIMGFIGPNGAGKSTTIGALLGLIHTDSGKCFIDGTEVSQLTKEEKSKIGVVLDDCCFPEVLTYPKVNKFMSKIYTNWDSEKFMNGCEKFGLSKKQPILKYSKGMKMKLSIISAMCHDAKLLIMDEATSGLDPIVREEILDMLLEFVQNEENSVFISSHIISDLEKICDYITFIKDGNIIFSAEKDMLKEDYGILRCSNNDFENIDKSCVVSYRQNSFSTDALVHKNMIKGDYVIDKVNIEDIMLYYVKGNKK